MGKRNKWIKTKADVAVDVFGVTYRTLYGWYKKGGNGVPPKRQDEFYRVVARRARAEENKIAGTAKQAKDKLGDPWFVLDCLRKAVPRVWS